MVPILSVHLKSGPHYIELWYRHRDLEIRSQPALRFRITATYLHPTAIRRSLIGLRCQNNNPRLKLSRKCAIIVQYLRWNILFNLLSVPLIN